MRMYKQCLLEKKNLRTTSYIPDKFAKVGSILQLKNSEGNWDDGWKVLNTSEAVSGTFIENAAHNADDIWKPSAAITNRGNK